MLWMKYPSTGNPLSKIVDFQRQSEHCTIPLPITNIVQYLGTYWVHNLFLESRTFHAPRDAIYLDVYRAVIAVTDHQPSHVCNNMRQATRFLPFSIEKNIVFWSGNRRFVGVCCQPRTTLATPLI